MPADLKVQLEALGEILMDLAPAVSTVEIKDATPVTHLDVVDDSWSIVGAQPSNDGRPRWLVAAVVFLVVGCGVVVVAARRIEAPGAINGRQPAVTATSVVSPTEPTPSTDTADAPGPTTTLAAAQSTVASTTTTVATPAVEFTPLVISSPPTGYALTWARYLDDGSDTIGFVRYVGPAGQPDLLLLIRPFADFFAIPISLGRQTWDVNGRVFINDNQGDDCAPDVCSIGVQWDGYTAASLTWAGSRTVSLGPEHTLQSLVDIAASITTAEPAIFEAGPVMPDAYGYDIDDAGRLPPLAVAGTAAGNPAVSVDAGLGRDDRFYIAARIALSLSDGRLVFEPLDGAPMLLDDRIHGGGPALPVPLWSDDPATHQRRLQDAVTIDDRIWMLYTETNPEACSTSLCELTVNLAPIDDLTKGTVIATLDSAAEISATTRLTLSRDGTIFGVIGRPQPTPFRASFDPRDIGAGATLVTASGAPLLAAMDDSGRTTVSLIDGALVVANAGESRTLQLPAGFTESTTVGLDITDTDGTATHGAIALSSIDGTISVIDLADSSVSVLAETTGLATFG